METKFNLLIFLICLGMLILLTFAPYFISKLSKSIYSDKFIARNWFAVVFPAVLTLYMVLVDGMDVLQADVTKYVILWAIIQGIIFSLTESAQKIIFRKGDWQLEVDTRKKHLTPDPSKPPSPSALPPQGEEKRTGKRLTPDPSPQERGERINKENNTLKNKGNESK